MMLQKSKSSVAAYIPYMFTRSHQLTFEYGFNIYEPSFVIFFLKNTFFPIFLKDLKGQNHVNIILQVYCWLANFISEW